MSFPVGTRVRTRSADPDHHTRLPRYVRGQIGEVVETEGRHTLPDESARRVPSPRVETVYAVRFRARDLWGAGDHTVIVDLWESYLEEVR
jgi:nitrile hydratase